MAAIPANHKENGREFHGWRQGLYMYPCDEAEMERLDILHNMFLTAFDKRLHNVPIQQPITENSDTRILDIGSGSGIWAVEVADQYPHAEVIGLDIVNKQPMQIPQNLRFRVPRDYEGMWSLGQNSFDLIYLRLACGGVSSWPELFSKVYHHLKPGVGWLEHIEIDFEPRCDDGPVPPRLAEWWRYLMDASERSGKPLRYDRNTPRTLQSLGFVDVQETVLRLPLNDWPSGGIDLDLGRWNCIIFGDSLEGLSMGPLTRVYQWPAEDIRRLCGEVKALSLNRHYHCYQTIHLITARRPG